MYAPRVEDEAPTFDLAALLDAGGGPDTVRDGPTPNLLTIADEQDTELAGEEEDDEAEDAAAEEAGEESGAATGEAVNSITGRRMLSAG